jgi:two-component system, cell cycle sensor histidine kinase and response regulator CckA
MDDKEKNVASRGTILVVDDDEMILEACGLLLARRGFGVLKARNGKKALEVFKRYRYQIELVILDIQMPVMDGERTFECLRQMDPNVRVLVISGYSNTGCVERMLQNGCKGFLQKPFNIADLTEKIEAIQTDQDAWRPHVRVRA